MTDTELLEIVKNTFAMDMAICTAFANSNPYEEMRARPERVLTDEEFAERVKRIRKDPIRKKRTNNYLSIRHGNIKGRIEGDEPNE